MKDWYGPKKEPLRKSRGAWVSELLISSGTLLSASLKPSERP